MKIIKESILLIALMSAPLMGCDGDASPDTTASRTASAALLGTPSLETMRGAMRPQERLLAVTRRGELVLGTPTEVMPDTDQPLLFTVRRVDATGKSLPTPEAMGQVEQVIASPEEDALLVLTAHHVLVRWQGDRLETIEEGVFGPVASSPSGRYLTYTRGEDPLFSVVRRDRRSGEAGEVSGELLGCWSPAVNDEGVVTFMASATGHGELYLARPGEAPSQLTHRAEGQEIATPTGPSAPLLSGMTLYFEDEQGAHRVALDAKGAPQSELFAPGARELVWRVDGAQFWGHHDTRLEAHTLTAAGGRP